ncbi:MAG: hypothetical protein OXR66_04635 [Candidatus Woesearchaeota archaeon]|nr:hypothetical protein [Candidatus Woesearchaeota archaeon]
MRPKNKRRSGWITAVSTIKRKWKEIINEALEPEKFYDEWENYRDGLRWNRDKTQLRSKHSYMAKHLDVERYNKKIKQHEKRRKARK